MMQVNDMDENIDGLVNNFAGKTYMGEVVESEEGCENLSFSLTQISQLYRKCFGSQWAQINGHYKFPLV